MPESIPDCKSVEIAQNFPPPAGSFSETSKKNITKNERRLEELSLVDELTTLYNRRHFNQLMDKEFKRAIRHKSKLTFMMVDVDNFKLYNDTYGHSMGDDVLRSVSFTLKNTLKRSEDTAFRLGGEEFGVLLVAVSKEDADKVGETLIGAIEDLEIEHSKNSASQYVTASMGIVTMIPTLNDSVDKLVIKADELLYKAKQNGRNRVVSTTD